MCHNVARLLVRPDSPQTWKTANDYKIHNFELKITQFEKHFELAFKFLCLYMFS